MDIRYSVDQRDVKRYAIQELRDESLVRDLYTASEVVAVYSRVDRMVTSGCIPTTETVSIDRRIDRWENFGVHYFLKRREIDIFDIGGSGRIMADGQEFRVGYKDRPHVTKGTREVYFPGGDASAPTKLYMVSVPTHASYTATYIPVVKAARRFYGASETADKRVINQFTHSNVLKTYQLSIDVAVLEEGDVWNTMSAHTRERRMEVYMYSEVSGDNVVFHMMGEPTEIRHTMMKNEEAVISPSQSIHSDAGTSSYIFIWTMGGENMEFDDMDTMIPNQMK